MGTKEFTSDDGRYKWLSNGTIFVGNHGKVFQGTDIVGHRVVAIKKRSKGDVTTEADILKSLSCPYIVKFIDLASFTTVDEKHTYRAKQTKNILVTEMVYNGPKLYEMMVNDVRYRNGLPDQIFLSLLTSLTSALSVLREHGICHSNISIYRIVLCISALGEMRFVLTDFELATNKGAGENHSKRIKVSKEVAEFLPLELYAKCVTNSGASVDNERDPSLDLLMTAVTLFYAATGRYPFQPFGYKTLAKCDYIVDHCHHTWLEMMQKMDNTTLWISQSSPNDEFVYHKQLPENIPMSKSLRIFVEKILFDLQSVRYELGCADDAFDRAYSTAQKIPLLTMDLCNVGQPSHLSRYYLKTLDYGTLLLITGEEMESTADFENQVLFFYGEQYFDPSTSSGFTISSNANSPPLISYVKLSALSDIAAPQQAPELDASHTTSDLESMKYYLEYIHSCVQVVPPLGQFNAFPDTLRGVLSLLSKRATSVMQEAKQFISQINNMVQLCAYPLNETWAKLLKFRSVLEDLLIVYEEFFSGSDSRFSKLFLTPELQMNHALCLEKLLTNCAAIVKKYDAKTGTSNNLYSKVDVEQCCQMARFSADCLQEAFQGLIRLQITVHKRLKTCASLFKRLNDLQNAVQDYRKIMDGLLTSLLENDNRETQQSANQSVRLTGYLMELVNRGRLLKSEILLMEEVFKPQ